MEQKHISINEFTDKEDALLGKQTLKNINLMKKKNQYRVTSYDPMCEDHAQIERVVPIAYSCFKLFIFIILTIITAGIFILVVIWFPKLQFYFIYSIVPIDQAKKVAIYGTDGELYFIPIKKPSLPDLEKTNSFIYILLSCIIVLFIYSSSATVYFSSCHNLILISPILCGFNIYNLIKPIHFSF